LKNAKVWTFSQLANGVGGKEGDPRWTVSGLASRAWKINHPDLPVVTNTDGTEKDIILQLHVRPPDEKSNRWLVVAQNKIEGPETHTSPRAVIVAKEDSPPGESWDIPGIAEAAARFFQNQKRDLTQVAEGVAPAGVVSRRNRVAARIVDIT